MQRVYRNSAELLARARVVTPSAAQTRSKAAEMFVEGAYPAFIETGDGCRVWDCDGNVFIDWIMGLAAIGLGYRCLPVDNSAISQINSRGVSFSLPTRLEAEVAERLIAMIPCAESVRFVKSGTEACEAAVRIARIATGRDVILSIGYHGWSAVFDAAKSEHPGVPDEFARVIHDVPYNDLDAAAKLFDFADAHGFLGRVAAILMEPTLIDAPAPGYLQAVRDLCHRYGALLIFDEMVTGFRWANGGAQEYFGVTPDLACFGKAIANGYPLSCVVGRRDLMAHATYASSTFGGEAVSLAAAGATLDFYKAQPVTKRMWEIGSYFIAGFNALARTLAVPFRCIGQGPHPRIVVEGDDPELARLLMSLFLQESAARGVLFHHGGLNVSWSHDLAILAETLTACEGALVTCHAGLTGGDVTAQLRGKPYVEAFRRVADEGHGG